MFVRAFRWVGNHVVGWLVVAALSAIGAALVGLWVQTKPPWNYVLSAGVFLLILALGVYVIQRWQAGLPPPWGVPYRPNTAPRAAGVADELNIADALTILKAPTPGSSATPLIDFSTEGLKDKAVDVGGRVRAIRIVAPLRQPKTLRKEDLPAKVRWHFRSILVIKRFAESAIVVDELIQGVRVRAELYYEDEREGGTVP